MSSVALRLLRESLGLVFCMEEEIWKDIVGYEGKYQVSNQGRVRTFFRHPEGRVLSQRKDKDGYMMCSPFKEGRRKVLKVHRLVALSFIPNPNGLPMINHKDENRANNKVENLEWCTSKYNANYGTHRVKLRNFAMFYGASLKPVLQYTKKGTRIGEYISSRMAERETNIPHQNIIQACRITSRTAGGFIWCYADDIERIKKIESLHSVV